MNNPNEQPGDLNSEADAAMIIWVWNKAAPCPGKPAHLWRKDRYGRVIKFDEHGKGNLPYGWLIVRVIPYSRGGADELSNLEPLHWQSRMERGESDPT